MSYKKFALMMVVSFIIMYLAMFLNIERIGHFHNSMTRIYMSLLMVAPMAVSMMIMMGKMYPSPKTNNIIIVSAIIVMVLAFAGLRTQTPIGDVQYMKAMIPHHSSAIMVSKNANILDPEVKKLSIQIIESQEKEISEMNQMLKRLE
jgi:uncharacterized protein (DUF305 family)